MNKVEVQISDLLNEKVYSTKLENSLTIYICKREGFSKKIGMFGTKYGSLVNEFRDIETNKKIKVPDGIAHFLEHKLFEMKGENALDLFSKIGVDSNAYTSYDQTVFYFETVNKFEESLKLLIKLVKEPYFTKENVLKEQGIISQEILMGNDDPEYILYLKALEAMYQNNNVKKDIAGSVDSIKEITPELLYTCYNTFYNLNNMFFVVVGDVDIENTIDIIDKEIKKYDKSSHKESIKIFKDEEPSNVVKKEVVTNIEYINLDKLCLGYKLQVVSGRENLKRCIITDIINDMYFSRLSDFYKNEYEKGILIEPLNIEYEGDYAFSHLLIFGETSNLDRLKKDLFEYIDKIKREDIEEELFEKVKSKNIGMAIMESDRLSSNYRRIIDSVIENTDVFDDVKILESIKKEDIKEFLELLCEENNVVSIVKSN